jgi:hypothetical protein
MWLKYGVALIAAISGFVSSWRNIQRVRRLCAHDDALLIWDEEPLPVWYLSMTFVSFIALHMSSVIVLGILFLFEMTAHQGSQTLFLLDVPRHTPVAELTQVYLWVEVIATFGFGFVWFLCGSLLAFPFAHRLIRPIHVAILPNGVASGTFRWEWSYFSYFSAEPRALLIRLYSNRVPEIASIVSRPRNADIFGPAVALLGQHLPPTPSRLPLAWYRRKSVRVALLLLAITIPCVLIGLFIYAFGFTWGWMYYTFITPLVAYFGGKLFMQML